MSVSFNKTGIVNTNSYEIKPNLLSNSDFSKTYQQTTGWDTTKNGTTLATGWGGYNSGVTNASTVYHAHMVQFQGKWVYVYIRTSNETWLATWQDNLQSSIKPNTTYTWSIDEYRTSGSENTITAGIYYKRNSSDSNNFWSGCVHGSGEDAFDKWVRRYYTFTTGDVYTESTIRMYIYGHSGGQGTIYMRRPKLEEGSIATPWSLKESEGNDINNHGFIETVSNQPFKIYKNNYIETKELYEI
jgi:hypothetical protein